MRHFAEFGRLLSMLLVLNVTVQLASTDESAPGLSAPEAGAAKDQNKEDAGVAESPSKPDGCSAEPIVFFDLTPGFSLNLEDEAQRWRFWDESHLVAALQGLVNRTGPRLYLRYISAADDFWWEQMTQDGGWLAGRPVVRVTSLEELLQRFQSFYHGVVVWDDRVPATSNVASTIAGCDDLLPVRFDARDGSLYRELTESGPRLEVKTRLLHPDGARLFTGQGKIPGTVRDSSGSAKNDAYLWMIEHYLRSGKANPQVMGYYLDADWHRSWKAAGPENHTLSNHDFVIARRGAMFDLNVWDDEACVDDPLQRPGTDVATLKELLHAAYQRFHGEGVIHVAGFVPWAFKYTDAAGAGGGHQAVPTEWRYAEILSCFNAYMDADALGLGAMANASFFQHYPLAPRYPQNEKPTRESLIERGLLDAQGRLVPRCYVAHYVGDYDAAAWLYRELPRLWRDPARGSTPLSWAFNPNLCVRFPLGMAWAREQRTANDWFVAGDSGAGYLNPGYLSPPRPHSGLPSGWPVWEKHCQELYRQWDISLTGFIIDGNARGLDQEGLDAYARFSADGIVAQQIDRQGLHGNMPYVRMATDLPGSPADAARTIGRLVTGLPPRFVVCRSILQSPSWYAQVEQELQTLSGEKIQVVDLYTLLGLVREYEAHRDTYPNSRYGRARDVSTRPDEFDGLSPLDVADGPLTMVTHAARRCWQVSGTGTDRYLYFEVDEAFYRPGGGPLQIICDYLDAGTGRMVLEYDSTDSAAALGGAYKIHDAVVWRGNTGTWQTTSFSIPDARFAGSQNGGADFRFFCEGDPLLIRRVRVVRP
ncbi:MAG: GxGYxYP domain-containing protein [Pirellulaceae bacterium]